MTEAHAHTLLIMLVGGLVALNTLSGSLLRKTLVPPLLVWLALGLGIRIFQNKTGMLPDVWEPAFRLLAEMGLVSLLFRTGLESDIKALTRQLRTAGVIWLSDSVGSGILGFSCAHFLLGFPVIPSLVVGLAFTATSVGVSVKVWESKGKLGSNSGSLLLDVAVLDDISGIIYMAVLFALLPMFTGAGAGVSWGQAASRAGIILATLVIFLGGVWVIMRYVERPLASFLNRMQTVRMTTLTVGALGIVLAALAEMIGFSLAIGAFFAGLIFSRDPTAQKMNDTFETLFEVFGPFFFIGIGLHITPNALTQGLGLGLLLATAAAGSKFVCNWVPVRLLRGKATALTMGLSMMPRAEITMVIMQKGMDLGPGIISRELFTAMVVVSATTCVAGPLLTNWILTRVDHEEDST